MHYGVPGMKWGVRKAQSETNGRTIRSAYKIARNDGIRARKAARDSGKLNGIGAVRKGNKIQREVTMESLKNQKRRKIKFEKAKQAYKQNDRLTAKYVKDVARDTGVDWNKAEKYGKKFDSSNERLTKRTEEYLSTFKKNEVRSLLKKDIEHGYHYVDARLFEPNLTYEKDVRVSNAFAKRYE